MRVGRMVLLCLVVVVLFVVPCRAQSPPPGGTHGPSAGYDPSSSWSPYYPGGRGDHGDGEVSPYNGPGGSSGGGEGQDGGDNDVLIPPGDFFGESLPGECFSFSVGVAGYKGKDENEIFSFFEDWLMGLFENLLNNLLKTIFEFPIRNLNETTEFISQSVVEGIKAETKALIKSFYQPGVLGLSFCYPTYDWYQQQVTELIRRQELGPGSGTDFYSALVSESLKKPGNPAIFYPAPPGFSSDKGKLGEAEANDYVSQVTTTTAALTGGGTGVKQLLKEKLKNIPDVIRRKYWGDVERLEAWNQANVQLATVGADAVIYSNEVINELRKFNPEEWDDLLFSQVIKDLTKLIYLQNQMLAKLLQLQGQMAIQMGSQGQLSVDERTQKVLNSFMTSVVDTSSGK